MARVKNMLLKGVRGKVGDLVYKVRNKETFVCAAPEINPNRKPTPAQLVAMELFKKRSDYAKNAIVDRFLKPMYEAAAKKYQPAYIIAFMDAVRPPEVRSIHAARNRKGVRESVIIRATDDFKVKEVKISIVSAKGKFIEEGNAIQQTDSDTWTYQTTKRNEIIAGAKIKAVASDFPGNEAELEITLN